MKIALFGAGGTIGQRIAHEALDRGHEVTAIVRDRAHFDRLDKRLKVVAGDVHDPASVARSVAGQDVVVSAIGPARDRDESPQVIVDAARSLIAGVSRAGVRRLIVVGGAGSLEVAPGVQLMDTPTFPAAWRPVAQAHRDALAVYRASDGSLDWTYLSPADIITPGERTGHYRTGADQLVTDEQGRSRISTEDYAVALVDEIEAPHFSRQRFTIAY